MVKTLRYSLMSILAMLCGTLMAADVVVDFNAMDLPVSYSANADQGIEASEAGDIVEPKTIEQNGVTIIISPKEEGKKDANRFWKTNNGPQLRCYSGTITIKYGSAMKSITFDAPSKFALTADKGTITEKTWNGEATEVVFTVAGNTQVNKITISTEGGEVTPVDPQPGGDTTGKGTLESPYTAADALAVVSKMEADVVSTQDYYIKGKISSIKYTFSAQYGTATFNISDNGQAGEGEFTCYSVYYLENKEWKEGYTQVAVGDDVIICGKVINYKGTTPETSSKKAYVYSLNGVTKVDSGTDPDPVVTDINVAKALETINGLADGTTTSEQYNVKGYVISISEISAQYGNATFIIADTKDASTGLTVFRSKGFNNENITDEQLLKVGDEVVVLGNLQKYVNKDNVMTPELTKGQIVSINGQGAGLNGIEHNVQKGQLYNLQGQRVMDVKRGLYIRDGKKFIVK